MFAIVSRHSDPACTRRFQHGRSCRAVLRPPDRAAASGPTARPCWPARRCPGVPLRQSRRRSDGPRRPGRESGRIRAGGRPRPALRSVRSSPVGYEASRPEQHRAGRAAEEEPRHPTVSQGLKASSDPHRHLLSAPGPAPDICWRAPDGPRQRSDVSRSARVAARRRLASGNKQRRHQAFSRPTRSTPQGGCGLGGAALEPAAERDIEIDRIGELLAAGE